MKKKQRRKGLMPLPLLLLTHVLVLGAALLIYALPHHVIVQKEEAIGLVSSRVASSHTQDVMVTAQPATAAPTLEPTAEPTAAPTAQPVEVDQPMAAPEATATAVPTQEPTAAPTPVPMETLPPVDKVGSFRIKFADHFTDGEVIQTENGYRSANLDISVSEHYSEEARARYVVVDAYIADISCLTTALAKDSFGYGYQEWPAEVAQRTGSIITMNGDFYGMRKTGVVIRNGVLYRAKPSSRDICLIYWDGVMKTISPRGFNAEAEIENGAYQAWNFGPMLLDEEGNAMRRFNSDYPYLTNPNPRSAIGYYEPGHYCFVVVDGRSDSSMGADLPQLSKIMADLGCKQAYNLDGGKTAMLYAKTNMLNQAYKGGRECSDFIMLMDADA